MQRSSRNAQAEYGVIEFSSVKECANILVEMNIVSELCFLLKLGV